MLNEPRCALVRPVRTLSTMTASRAMGDLQRVWAETSLAPETGSHRLSGRRSGHKARSARGQLDDVARADRDAEVLDARGGREQALERTELARREREEAQPHLFTVAPHDLGAHEQRLLAHAAVQREADLAAQQQRHRGRDAEPRE